MSWFQRWFGLGKKEEALLALKLRLSRWRHLLKTEESCLNTLADMREKLSGEYVLDGQYIFDRLSQVFQKAYQVAYDMGILRGLPAVPMYAWLDRIKDRIMAYLKNWPWVQEGPLVVPLAGMDFPRPDQIGEMGAQLLEITKLGTIDIPPGFIITIQGFSHLLRANHLDHHLKGVSSGKATFMERYQSLSTGLLEATIPAALKDAIGQAMQSLRTNEEPFPPLFLCPSPTKSSAVAIFPFPVLTWPGGSLEALWNALCSLWSKVYASLELEDPGRYPLLSAVICQRRISGGRELVVQTLDPTHPDLREFLVRPVMKDVPSNPSEVASDKSRILRTSTAQAGDPGGGENPGRDPEKRPGLKQLFLRLENHFKRAQETLWREDGRGNLYLIQLRFQEVPLDFAYALAEKLPPRLKDWPRYSGLRGKIVSRGIASGPAVYMKPGEDLGVFPEGGVLMARKWCPEWKALLPKISAILLEQSPFPSLAFLTRSYRIPTVAQLPSVREKIAGDAFITVDADDNFIYEGQVEPLLHSQLLQGSRLEDEPEYLLLDGILRAIDHSYSVEEKEMPGKDLGNCRTLLEGIQWAHEQVMAVLFEPTAGDRWIRERWALPVSGQDHLSIYVMDLGGGLTGSKSSPGTLTAIGRTQITSTPWAALSQGILTPPLSGKTFEPEAEKPPALLIVSENALFLGQSAGTTKLIVDAVLTGIPELDHFFLRCEGKKNGQDLRAILSPGFLEADFAHGRQVYEIRSFGSSTAEIKEYLKQAGGRLDP
jgi:phosphohistidine swiveling domain-containing protein